MAVPVRTELLAQVGSVGARLVSGIARGLRDGRRDVEGLSRGLPDPRRLLETSTQRLDDFAQRLVETRFVEVRAQRARELGLRLPDPRQYVELRRQRLSGFGATLRALQRKLGDTLRREAELLPRLDERLHGGVRRNLADGRTRLESQLNLLEGLSYERVLDRGFALVRHALGAPVTSVRGVAPDDRVVIQFRDGKADALIAGRAGTRTLSTLKRRAKRKIGEADPQGDLL